MGKLGNQSRGSGQGSLDGRSVFSPGRGEHNESPVHFLHRVYGPQELDQIKRGLGQVKDLCHAASAHTPRILELQSQGWTQKAIAQELGLGRKAVGRVLAQVQSSGWASRHGRSSTSC